VHYSAADLEALIPRLRRYAHALTRHPVHADDLVQDTLERAWARRGQWRADSNLRAWVFTIMHNLFINGLRRFEPEQLPDGFADDFADEFAANPGTASATGLLDLERALARLNPAQRSVLLLVGLEDLSYQQTAAVLGIPIGTVMSRLARARQNLRVLMEGGVSAPPSVDASGARPVLKVVK